MAEQLICVSTKKRISNEKGAVRFPCPACKAEIVRSHHARAIAAKYTCSKCGFTGPN